MPPLSELPPIHAAAHYDRLEEVKRLIKEHPSLIRLRFISLPLDQDRENEYVYEGELMSFVRYFAVLLPIDRITLKA